MLEHQRIARNLFQLGFMILLIAASVFIFRSENRLMDRPFSEDGFYALSVSQHLAMGQGLSVDGLHLTNGFHPLWVVMASPMYLLQDLTGIHALRLVLLIEWFFYMLTAITLASTVCRAVKNRTDSDGCLPIKLLFWITAFLYIAAPISFKNHFNGLETGITLFLLVLTARVAQGVSIYSARGAWIIGALLGLCVLARIDNTLLVFTVCTATILMPSNIPVAKRIKASLIIGFVSVLISLPWWIYNYSQFGSIMPTSGAAQTYVALKQYRFVKMTKAILRVLVPWIYAGRFGIKYIAWLQVATLLVGSFTVWKTGLCQKVSQALGTLSKNHRGRLGVASFVGFVFLLASYYTITSVATTFYERYLSPVVPVSVAVVSLFVAAVVTRCVSWGRLRVYTIGLLLLIATGIPLGIQIGYYWGIGSNGAFCSVYLRDQAALVDRYVDETEFVAAWQSGTLGYYRDHVINTDGKVNPEALRRRNDLPAYLAELGVQWFCDWDWCVERSLGPEPKANGWVLVDTSGVFKLWHRPDATNDGHTRPAIEYKRKKRVGRQRSSS